MTTNINWSRRGMDDGVGLLGPAESSKWPIEVDINGNRKWNKQSANESGMHLIVSQLVGNYYSVACGWVRSKVYQLGE